MHWNDHPAWFLWMFEYSVGAFLAVSDPARAFNHGHYLLSSHCTCDGNGMPLTRFSDSLSSVLTKLDLIGLERDAAKGSDELQQRNRKFPVHRDIASC